MEIRKMTGEYAGEVIEMMRIFYASDAVHTNGSEEIFQKDVEHCITENPYLEGYVFVEAEQVTGYAMVAKSFSTEFGKPCIWIEDLYIKEPYRGCGIGSAFFKLIGEKYADHLFRLEAEEENERAIAVYKKNGFEVLPYLEMKKEN